MLASSNFELLTLIGRGKYGDVWQARNKTTSNLVAVKKLELRDQNDEEYETLRREADLLSRLAHPNIVACYGYYDIPGSALCIVMQYCESGDLSSRLREQKGELVEENQIMEWFIQICMALQYLHHQHILHRDLKTQNIFLTQRRFVKLGDFGIARSLKNGCDMAETFIGTPFYMSPELFANKPYNSKTDIWSLGCCLHEMMTLKYAFTASSLPALMKIIAKGQIPDLPRCYSKDLITLCKQLLNPKPSQRPSANQVLMKPLVISHIKKFLQENRFDNAALQMDSTGNEAGKKLTTKSSPANKAQLVTKPETSSQDDVTQQHNSIAETKPCSSPGAKSPRKKKQFLKERAASKISYPSCDPMSKSPPKPPKRKVKSKGSTKPRPLPIPPICITGEPIHRKEIRRVSNAENNHIDYQPLSSCDQYSSNQNTGLFNCKQNYSSTNHRPDSSTSESSSSNHRPDSSTSASSLEEVKLENNPLEQSVKSSTNFTARRRRREKNSMTLSSSVEFQRLQGSVTCRISPPQTLIPSLVEETHQSVIEKGDNPHYTENPLNQAFNNGRQQDVPNDVETMIGLFNETLNNEGTQSSPLDTLSSEEDQFVLHSSENGSSAIEEDRLNHVWIENIPPDIKKSKLERFKLLKEECIDVIGSELFHYACSILETQPEDRMESALIDLLGQQTYEGYGLKIWQLKFMRETIATDSELQDFYQGSKYV